MPLTIRPLHPRFAADVAGLDNRRTVRRTREYDETRVRDMRRATVSDGTPTVLERAAA